MLQQAVLALLVIALTNASDPALKETALQAICEVSSRLGTITPKATERLTTMTNRQQVYTNAALKLQVLASRTADQNSTVLFAAMANLAAEKASQQQTQTLTEAIPKLTPAVADAEMTRGQIHELISFLHTAQTTTSKNGYCLANGGGNHPADSAKTGGCIVQGITTTPDPSPINDDFVDSNGFKDLRGVADAKATTTGGSSCIVFKPHNSAQTTEVFQNGENTNAGLIGGLLTFKTNAGGTETTLSVEDPSTIATNGVHQSGKALKRAYEAVIAAKEHMGSISHLTPEQVLVELTQSSDLEAQLTAELKKTPTTENADSADKTAKEIITSIAQPQKDDGKTVWKLLDKEIVEGAEDKAKGKTKLSTLEETGKLMAVLSYHAARRVAKVRELEAKLKTAQGTTKVVTKTLEEVCNEIKDADTCRNNDNCK